MSMVDEPDFLKLLDAAREKLTMKLRMGLINEREKKVSRICINNMSHLMKKSKIDPQNVLVNPEGKVRQRKRSAPSLPQQGQL